MHVVTREGEGTPRGVVVREREFSYGTFWI